MWIMWITLKKNYPRKKLSKIACLQKISTFESELSTRYPLCYPQKNKHFFYPHLMWIKFCKVVNNFKKLVPDNTKMWIMWITLLWITLRYSHIKIGIFTYVDKLFTACCCLFIKIFMYINLHNGWKIYPKLLLIFGIVI